MQPSSSSAMRLSAPHAAVLLILAMALTLLIGKRLDLRFAGGTGSGSHAKAMLVETTGAMPSSLTRGDIVTTDASTFASYRVGDACTIFLAENSSLLFQDGRQDHITFTFLTGRIVAKGDCTFTVRDMRFPVLGSAMLVHYSWLNTLDIKPLANDTHTPALRFSTLPNRSSPYEVPFSLEYPDLVSSFYQWSLSQ